MPLDASIYNTQAPAPVNPLQTLSTLQGLSNAQQQNIGQQISNQRGRVGLSADQASIAMDQYNHLNKVIGDLSVKANSKEGITQNEMITEALNARKQGIISDDGFNNFVAGLGDDTPQNNAATVAKLQYKIQDAAKQHAITYGQNAQVQNGSQITQGVVADPMYNGGFTPATAQNVTLTPGEEAARVQAIGPNGAPISLPQSALSTPTGMPKDSTHQDTGANPTSSDSIDNLMPQGQVSKSQMAVNAAVNNPSLPKGALQTGYAPGTVEAAGEVGHVAGQNLANDVTALNNSPQTLYQMEAAGKALQNAPTGKGSETRNALKSYATAFAPEIFKNTDWANDVDAYDSATKYLTQQAQRMGAQIGPNTNAGMASAITGSPNTHINNLTAQELQAVLTGMTRLNLARTAAFQEQNPNGTAQDYQKFGQPFNQTVDPRGFMIDLMPKAQAAKLLKEVGPSTFKNGEPNPARQKLDNAYNMATKYGFMTDITQGKNGQ